MAWILAGACLVAGLAGLLVHSTGAVEMVPITSDQVAKIAGPDLSWNPLPARKPAVALAEVDKLTSKIPYISLGRTDADILKVAPKIDKTQTAMDAVERLIAGKDPAPPTISKVGDHVFALESSVLRKYRYQFELALARGNAPAAIDRLERMLAFDAFIDRYSGNRLASLGASLDSAISHALRRNAFSTSQLTFVYSLVKPAKPNEGQLRSGLIYEFQCLAELIAGISRNDLADLQGVQEVTAPYSYPTSSKPLLAGQFDAPATVRLAAGLYREAIRNSAVPTPKQSWTQAQAYEKLIAAIPKPPERNDGDPSTKTWFEETWFKWRMRTIPNVLGLTTLQNVLGDDGPRIEISASHGNCMKIEAARLMIALAIFKRSKGSLPHSLSDLRSLNLPGPEPVDSLAGAPFHFDESREIFWSFGENGKDDGGRNDRGSGPADDFVFQVP